MQAEPGAKSLTELQADFLRHHRSNAVDSLMGLFYLKGASQEMVDLYRRGVPKVEELTIVSAEILEIPPARRTSIPHTLEPEKLLLLKFGRGNQAGLVATEQFFFIGRHQGRYYFTLPNGE
jgi:hypothetical protein